MYSVGSSEHSTRAFDVFRSRLSLRYRVGLLIERLFLGSQNGRTDKLALHACVIRGESGTGIRRLGEKSCHIKPMAA
jgi:hypothetical protein